MLKKTILNLFLAFTFLSHYAHAQEQILSFESNLQAFEDGKVQIEETIVYDFYNLQRHGIIRNIKVVFENNEGVKMETPIKVSRVISEKGEPYEFSISKDDGELSIKIGDADKTITGVHTYKILYSAEGYIEGYSDHDEIYWNVTGNNWEVPILNSKATITLPSQVPTTSYKTDCFTGIIGTTGKICGIADTEDLKSDFPLQAAKIKGQLYSQVVSLGLFPTNPDTIRKGWAFAGFMAMVTVNIPFGIVAILLSNAMPRKTIKGSKAQVEALGLKKFLTSQARQFEFQEANWYLFEKLLPYAIAFGVTETWAKRFENLQTIPEGATWYSSRSGITNIHSFVPAMSSFGHSINYVATPTSSSSGYSSGFSGGSSGGGSSGGGGGGSW